MTILSGMKAAIRNDARTVTFAQRSEENHHHPRINNGQEPAPRQQTQKQQPYPYQSPMEPIDIVRLEEAVVSFYRSNSQNQAITHEWLTDAEASPQAWQFSWQLMQLGKVSTQYPAGPAHQCIDSPGYVY